jgi:hypothetical protein
VLSLVSDIMTWNQTSNCLESKADPDWRKFTWCPSVEKWWCYCFLIPKALFSSTGTSEANYEWWVLCKDTKGCFAECISAKGPEFMVKCWFWLQNSAQPTYHVSGAVSRHGWYTCRTPTLQSRHCCLWFMGISSTYISSDLEMMQTAAAARRMMSESSLLLMVEKWISCCHCVCVCVCARARARVSLYV